MDPNDIPYGSDDSTETEKDAKPKTSPKPKAQPTRSTLSVLDPEDEDDLEDEDEDEDEEGLDDAANEDDEIVPFYKTPKGMAIIGGAVVLVLAAIWFIFFKKEPEPPPPPPAPDEEVEEVDPKDVMREELYQIGIGKESLNEQRIYEQGNIESEDFRKDFTNTGVPENYVTPIEIVGVNESVSYVKHRTVTGNGIDVYWVDAVYKSQKTVFTVPYYIWRTLAPEGVMDVVVEVITDADKNVYIGSITAIPPSSKK